MTTILLHSGGLDSHLVWLRHPHWHPVYVVHDAPNEDNERAALRRLKRADPRFGYNLVGLPSLNAEPDGHIPFRNMLLATTVLHHYPHATAIAYGALLGEGSGDKSARFRRALENTWQLSENRRIRLLAPLARTTKARAWKAAAALPGAEHLNLTVSCYHQPNPGCGMCQGCFRRGIAAYLVGASDTLPDLPIETYGALATLRANPIRRWPALAAANLDVVEAFARHQLHRVRAR